MIPFDSYFQSDRPAEVEPITAADPAILTVLPDPLKTEPVISVAQKISRPKKIKPKKVEPKHIGKFQPLNEDTIAKAKCDILRLGIVMALREGKFEFLALLHLMNLWIAEQDIPETVFAKATLAQVLSYNPIGWKYENNRVWRTKKCSAKDFKKLEHKGLTAMIMLVLDKLVREKKVERIGTNRFKNVPD